jgi:putative membrane protein
MMIRTATLYLVAFALMLVSPNAPGQVPATGTVTQSTQTRTQAVQQVQGAVPGVLFAAAAPSGGLAEVNISQIGLQRATDPELRRFSQQMVEDHTRMNQEVMTLAGQKRMSIPEGIDARAQFCAKCLARLTGPEFDKCYAKAQFFAPLDAVAMFKAEAERGQDPGMKALAARALPKIKQHLKTIKPIAMRYEDEKTHDRSAGQAGHNESSR